jgi:hypothetical protein
MDQTRNYRNNYIQKLKKTMWRNRSQKCNEALAYNLSLQIVDSLFLHLYDVRWAT